MPQSALSEQKASGRPTSFEKVTGKEIDRRSRRYIRINDEDLWKKIDLIMTLPEYRKSFNKVINAALFYGLDELIHSLFDPVETEIMEAQVKFVRKIDGINEEYFGRVVNLLKEILLNSNINKSILGSLYTVKSRELKQQGISAVIFDEGYYGDTPDYLSAYEERVRKRLQEERTNIGEGC